MKRHKNTKSINKNDFSQKDLPPVDKKSSEKIDATIGDNLSVNQSSNVNSQNNEDIETGVQRVTNQGVE